MKQAKRLFVAFLCLALVLTSTLLVVVACGEEGFSITVLSYDKEEGTVKVSAPAEGKLYDADEKVVVNVTPNTNYTVKTFVVNGVEQELTNGSYTFEITQDTSIGATFEKKPTPKTYTLSFALGEHAAEDAETPPSQNLAANAKTTLPDAPIAEKGWKFAGWGEEKWQANGTYTMPSENKEFEAQWTKDTSTYEITSQVGEHGSLSFDPDGPNYAAGTTVTVFVTPEEGYEVDTFTVNEEVQPLSATNTYTFSVYENTTIAVTFRLQTFTIDITIAEGKGEIELEPQKERYNLNESVKVTVRPNEYYEFVSLTVNGASATLDAKNSVTINVTQNIILTARFKAVESAVTSIPQQFQGSWTQINPLANHVGKVTITETEFKYDNDVVGEKTFPVFQTVEGYFYKDGNFKTYFGMLGEDVFYIEMSASLRFLFTKDGQIVDKPFPSELNDTRWQNDTMGRVEVNNDSATLDGKKMYLLHAETENSAVRLHIMYDMSYWIFTYTEGADAINFAQPGGAGQNTIYNRVGESFLGDEYFGNWTLVGGDKTVTVNRDGRLSYCGEIYPVIEAYKKRYAYEFSFGNKNYGLGVIGGYDLLFVLNLTDEVYELYVPQGAELPNESVKLPATYNGDWTYTDSAQTVHTLHIENGQMTIDGKPVYYFGQESNSGSYIARAIYDDVYWDVTITLSGIEFGNIMCDYSPNEKWYVVFTQNGTPQQENVNIVGDLQSAQRQFGVVASAQPNSVTVADKSFICSKPLAVTTKFYE